MKYNIQYVFIFYVLRVNMKKMTSLALISSVALIYPYQTHADEKQLEKRLEILEAKMERMAALEEENKKLKLRLEKAEAKVEKFTNKNISTASLNKVIEPSLNQIPSNRNQTEITASQSDWQGVYVGINAGYGRGNINRSSFTPGNISGFSLLSATDNFFAEGPIAGGQIGYNYRLPSNFIVGGEVDVDWSDVIDANGYNNSTTGMLLNASSGPYYNSPLIVNYRSTNNYNRVGMNWVGTARARLGYAISNFMPYITGGLAFGAVSSINNLKNLSVNDPNSYTGSYTGPNFTNAGTYGDAGKVQLGWALGAGGEYMLADKWSVKAEYLYTSIAGLNRTDTTYAGGVGLVDPFNSNSGYKYYTPIPTSVMQVTTGSFGIHQARVGLNYHIGWLGSALSNNTQ